jgi:hypothetical protein
MAHGAIDHVERKSSERGAHGRMEFAFSPSLRGGTVRATGVIVAFAFPGQPAREMGTLGP